MTRTDVINSYIKSRAKRCLQIKKKPQNSLQAAYIRDGQGLIYKITTFSVNI